MGSVALAGFRRGMKGSARFWRLLLTLALVAAAFAFLYHTAATNWRELNEFAWRVHAGLLIASVLAHVVVLGWGVYLWSLILRLFGSPPVAYGGLLKVWALSNTARYIPGAVWQFVTAAQLSRGAGLPGVLALTSMLVHVLLSLLAAVTISVLMLPLDALGLGALSSWWARGGVLLVALAAVHPGPLNLALRAVPRVLHREVLVWQGRWWHGVVLLLLANLSWLLYGVAYSLFIAALAPVPLDAFGLLTGVNALSFTIGYIAVLAPGGIGVRESAMTILLGPLLPAGVAAVVAVAARLWSIAAEVLLALAGTVLARPGPRFRTPAS